MIITIILMAGELGMSFLQGLGRVQDVRENMIDPVDISKGTKMSTVVTTGMAIS